MRGTKSLVSKLNGILDCVKDELPKTIESEAKNRADKAQYGFDQAEYVGIRDATVSVTRPDAATWNITASGESVLFIEYGTGINLGTPTGGFAGMNYLPGSYSRTHKEYLTNPKKLAHWGGWWPIDPGIPGGQEITVSDRRGFIHDYYATQGNPSANIMYDTEKMLTDTLHVDLNRILARAIKA